MDRSILRRCPLFKGLKDAELERALAFFDARERVCARGEVLNRPGEPLRRFGLVLSGSIMVFMDDFDGNSLLMASVTPGVTFGESLCFLGIDAQVRIMCASDGAILTLDPSRLKDCATHTDAFEASLCVRFTSMLAERALALNDRIQVLRKKTIREKVVTLLSQYSAKGSGKVELPYNREAMAIYLGVNQSALSRELSRMQDEGIISFSGSRFMIEQAAKE